MPFSTFGPIISRLLYGRGIRSYRVPCFLFALMILPLGLLFYYAASDSPNTTLVGGLDHPKFRRNLENSVNENILEKRTLPGRDALLEQLIMAKSPRKNNPIPDTRPNDCIASSSEDSPPALEQIRDRMPSIRTTIVVYPDQKHSTIADYQLTLASILTTTEPFYEKLEVAIVINEFLTNDVVKYLEQLKDAKMPMFYLVKPKSTRKTLFHELMELGDQIRGDIMVYLASGLETNAGWLEAMIMPLMTQPTAPVPQRHPKPIISKSSEAHDLIRQLQPVIVTPHFDRIRNLEEGEKHYEPESEFIRLLFHWNLKPMWYEISFEDLLHRNSEAEEIGAPAFLPHAFAVNKTSPLYGKLYSYFSQRENDDTTSFEAALYIWRCLNAAVVIAPCARIGSQNAYLVNEFDPRLIPGTDDNIKKRIAETWFEDYRAIALRLITDEQAADAGAKIEGVLGAANMPPESCSRSFFWYMQNVAKEVVIPEEHAAFGWFKSGGGACFRAAIEHRLLGGSCTVLSDSHIFFLEKDGSIRTRTGLCLSSPDQLSYIELVECDSKDTKQRWIYDSDGTLKSSHKGIETKDKEIKERCIMHATDPDEEKRGRQILMLYNCKDLTTEKEFAPFQKFTFTYKIV